MKLTEKVKKLLKRINVEIIELQEKYRKGDVIYLEGGTYTIPKDGTYKISGVMCLSGNLQDR